MSSIHVADGVRRLEQRKVKWRVTIFALLRYAQVLESLEAFGRRAAR